MYAPSVDHASAVELDCDLASAPPAEDRPSAELVVSPFMELQLDARLPEAVRLDGLHVPTGQRPLLWVEQVGSGAYLPISVEDEAGEAALSLFSGRIEASSLRPDMRAVLHEAGVLLAPGQIERARSEWSAVASQARQDLAVHGVAVVRRFLSPPLASLLDRHVTRLAQAGALARGDEMSALRLVQHNAPAARLLHAPLARLLASIALEPIKPSYCYLAHYLPGARVCRHVDRDQCALSLSLAIGATPAADADLAWPLYVEVDGRTHAARLAPGDFAVFAGTRAPHWRDELDAGRSATFCFYHFVPESFSGSLD